MGNVRVSRHPLVLHHLTRLRDYRTPAPDFRRAVRDLAWLLFVEAAEDLRLVSRTVRTPLAECDGHELADRIGLFPILRAGLGIADALLEHLPNAQVWHLGLYRDEETARPVTYYSKLPGKPTVDVALLLDPMLATGGSAVAAVNILHEWGVRRIKYLGLIAAPEGVQFLVEHHPDVSLHLGAIDSHLNERKYIVPGLGDAGDRQFATWADH
jgi:uracil phosphoribosyltransferase